MNDSASEGYRVGTEHPRSEIPNVERRQYHSLSDSEVADLVDAVVYALARELVRFDVAGADRADTWELADQVRQTVTRNHDAAFRRYLVQRREYCSSSGQF